MITRMVYAHTRDYMERCMKTGPTKKEAIRCLNLAGLGWMNDARHRPSLNSQAVRPHCADSVSLGPTPLVGPTKRA